MHCHHQCHRARLTYLDFRGVAIGLFKATGPKIRSDVEDL